MPSLFCPDCGAPIASERAVLVGGTLLHLWCYERRTMRKPGRLRRG